MTRRAAVHALGFEIRTLRAGDLPRLNRLLPKWHPDVYARRLAAQDRGELAQAVAWVGEDPVGSGMVLFPAHEEWSVSALRERCAEVRDVGVTEGFRRRGIARALMGALEDAAREHGSGRIGLTVDVDEEPARALYDALGYEVAHGPFLASTDLETPRGLLAVGGVFLYLTNEL